MKIRFEQPYVPSEDPAAVRRLSRAVDWPAVPVVGDFVMHGDGPVAARVVRVFWDDGGLPVVHLHGNHAEGPTLSAADVAALEGHGWHPDHRGGDADAARQSLAADEAGDESFPASDPPSTY